MANIYITPTNPGTTSGGLVGTVPDTSLPGVFLVQPIGGAVPAITLTESLASQPTVRLVDSELTLGYAGSTTISGSAASVRGNTTIAAGTTIIGASYSYGVQGKLTVKGIMSGSAEVSCGLLGQLDLSASLGLTAPVAAIWADCGATAGTVTGANIDAMVVYNTTAAKINSAIRVDTNSTYFLDLSDEGGGHGAGNWIIATAKGSGWDKSLKINLNGTAYYIPCNSAAS